MSRVLVFGADDLSRVRFAMSPLWETFSALRVLSEPHRRPYHLPWLEAVRPKLGEVEVDLLLALSPRVGWTPDFLTPIPDGPSATLEEELRRVRATTADQASSEINRSFAERGGEPVPPVAMRLLQEPERAPGLLADVLGQCWQLLVAPYWPRLRDLLEADIRHRTRVLGDYGLERAVADLHPRVRWERQKLIIQSGISERCRLDGAGLVLLPSAFTWPDIGTIMEPPAQPTVFYPARGIAELWKPVPTAGSEPLCRLLGTTRASLLQSLTEPASTTTLADRHGLSPSTVSEHLSALRDTGLITRWRHRHAVLYQQTSTGAQLAKCSPEATTAKEPI